MLLRTVPSLANMLAQCVALPQPLPTRRPPRALRWFRAMHSRNERLRPKHIIPPLHASGPARAGSPAGTLAGRRGATWRRSRGPRRSPATSSRHARPPVPHHHHSRSSASGAPLPTLQPEAATDGSWGRVRTRVTLRGPFRGRAHGGDANEWGRDPSEARPDPPASSACVLKSPRGPRRGPPPSPTPPFPPTPPAAALPRQ